MRWEFDDGARVDLGGKVEGASLFAQDLRRRLAAGVEVELGPHPSPTAPLDVNDPTLLDAWLVQQRALWPHRDSVRFLKRPKVEPLPEWKRPDDVPDDAMF